MAKFEFLVAIDEVFTSDLEYEIVDRYYPGAAAFGYKVYRVETDDIHNIRVFDKRTRIDYEAAEAVECKDGDETIYAVNYWSPIDWTGKD